MKTAISLIFFYILLSVCGIALCGLLFMICEGLRFFVVGNPLDVFSLNLFLHGVYYSVPCVCILSHLLSILFIMRQRNNSKHSNYLVSFIVYIVLGIFTWCFLFPQTIYFARDFENAKLEVGNISTGYFRACSDGVYYYSKVYENGKGDGIFIDTKTRSISGGTATQFFNRDTKNVSTDDYADVLVRDAINIPEVVSYPIKVYKTILKAAKSSWAEGKLAWLSFATIGLALFSLYGIQFSSSWKMVSAVFVLLFGVGIIYLNYMFYSNMIPEYILKYQDKLPSLFSLEKSMIVYVNILMALIFSTYGTIMAVIRIRKVKSGAFDEEEGNV